MQYVKSLAREQTIEALRQTHSIWGGTLALEARVERQLNRLAAAGPELYSMSGLTDDEGNLRCSMKRYYFGLSLRHKSFKSIGLGAIFTHPDHRKQGSAAQLIQTVLKEAKEKLGCEAAILYSDIDPSYYERFGFAMLPAQSWSVSVASLLSERAFELKEATAGDVPALLKLYDKFTIGTSARTERNRKSWILFHEMNGVDKTYFLMDEANVAGYVSMNQNEDRLWVDEAYAPATQEQRLWETVRRHAVSLKAEKVQGWSLPNYRWLTQTEGYDLKPRTKAIPMIAMLNPAGTRITPEIMESAHFPSSDHF